MKLPLVPIMFCLGLSLFIDGCASQYEQDVVYLKKGPLPEIVMADDGTVPLVYGNVIKKQIQKDIPGVDKIMVGDKRYMFITEKWFTGLIDWTEYFIRQQIPQSERWDDLPVAYEGTFVELMASFANISVAKRYNIEASVLIGLVTATSHEPWGQIKADGKERVYLIGLTENGGLVYDFTTKQMIAFKDFPNLQHIHGVML